MKIYLQRRLVDGSALASINSIISGGNYITDTADDFQWNWAATSASQPDTRHPRYGLNYQSAGANDYLTKPINLDSFRKRLRKYMPDES